MLEAVTGLKIDVKEMLDIGARNFLLLKILAFREGYSRKDEGLHKRFSTPMPRDASANQIITDEDMQEVVDEYYKLRGLKEKAPTDEILEELGLSELKGIV